MLYEGKCKWSYGPSCPVDFPLNIFIHSCVAEFDCSLSMHIWQIPAFDRNGYMLVGTLAFLSFCVNPLIYASRYEVFRRYLKKTLGRE